MKVKRRGLFPVILSISFPEPEKFLCWDAKPRVHHSEVVLERGVPGAEEAENYYTCKPLGPEALYLELQKC
jgi:hypothetical protein